MDLLLRTPCSYGLSFGLILADKIKSEVILNFQESLLKGEAYCQDSFNTPMLLVHPLHFYFSNVDIITELKATMSEPREQKHVSGELTRKTGK